MLPVRVLIADDHRLFAESLMVSLSQDDRLDVVGIAGDGAEALELAESLQPDVLLLDVQMPRLSGIEVLRELRSRAFAGKVVIVTGSTSSTDEADAVDVGADAFVLKSAATIDLLNVVLVVVAAVGVQSG